MNRTALRLFIFYYQLYILIQLFLLQPLKAYFDNYKFIFYFFNFLRFNLKIIERFPNCRYYLIPSVMINTFAYLNDRFIYFNVKYFSVFNKFLKINAFIVEIYHWKFEPY
jgi:hypothetical protein